jgi:hypothetical protein
MSEIIEESPLPEEVAGGSDVCAAEVVGAGGSDV